MHMANRFCSLQLPSVAIKMDPTEAEIMDISKLKVPELKKELKNRGLSVSGNKTDLIERLNNSMKNKDDAMSAESVEDLDEDLLNDDDDEHIDESEVLNDLDSPVEMTPVPPKLLKRKSGDLGEGVVLDPPKQARKIILHRNISMTDDENGKDDETKTEKVEEATDDAGKKVIKLSELSAKERLELRAKKFGQPLSGDALKLARAERFSGSKTTSSGSVSISAAAPPTVDVLKQRAQRFGVSVSATLTKMENQEKLDKRKERFGSTTNGTTTTSSTPTSALTTKTTNTTDKAAQRLERFKQPIK